MASIDELSQQLHARENDLFAATREVERLQSQLDESRERESNLASEQQLDAVRMGDQISTLTRQQEVLEARYRESAAAHRSLEEARKADEANTHRLERELRSALLDLHAKEGEVAELMKKQHGLVEAQERCEALKRRVGELEEMQKEGREEYRLQAQRAQELADQLSRKDAEVEAARREAELLAAANERLVEEVNGLMAAASHVEDEYAAKPLSMQDNVRARAVSHPPDEHEEATTARHFSERLDIAGDNITHYGLHDDFGTQTPRRSSIMVPGDTGYAEPLLKDETMVGLPTALNMRRLIDKETQTMVAMSNEPTPRGDAQGCPQCVIC